MSLLINLLPDLRQAKLREHRRRQLAIGISVSIWVVCGIVVGTLFLYTAGQKVFIASVSNQIADKTKELKAIPDIETAITAQAHSASLKELYGKRIYMSKFFQAYMSASPQDVVLNALSVDDLNTLTVNGKGRNYAAVAKLARALEASNITVGEGADPENVPYFTGVNITSTERSDADGSVTFTLKAVVGSGATSVSD